MTYPSIVLFANSSATHIRYDVLFCFFCACSILSLNLSREMCFSVGELRRTLSYECMEHESSDFPIVL